MGSWPKEELLRRFLPLLREQAQKRRIPAEDIEDVIHAALLRSRVRDDCPPLDPDQARAWLLAVCEFGRLTYVSKQRRARAELYRDPDELHAVAASVDEEAWIEGWDFVLRALCALPTELREAFWEHVFEGASVEETAARLGITERMAKRRIADAKRKLRGVVDRLDSTARGRFAVVLLLLFSDTFRLAPLEEALLAAVFEADFGGASRSPRRSARPSPAMRPRSSEHPRTVLCGALIVAVATFLGSDTLAQTTNEGPEARAVVAMEVEQIARVPPAPGDLHRCVEPSAVRPPQRGRGGWRDATRVFEARAHQARGEEEEARRLLQKESLARSREEERHAP